MIFVQHDRTNAAQQDHADLFSIHIEAQVTLK
jgi:hypothetical protein